MSVWEMDCSGKGSVVFRLRNNFLHFWDFCFLLLFFFSQGRAGVGRGWVHLLNSISGCLCVSTFGIGSRNQICFSQLGNGPNKLLYPCLTFHFLQF